MGREGRVLLARIVVAMDQFGKSTGREKGTIETEAARVGVVAWFGGRC